MPAQAIAPAPPCSTPYSRVAGRVTRGSAHGDGVARRAGRPLQAQRGEDEGELVDLVAGQLFQVEVLQVVDAVADQQQLVDLEGAVLVLVRHRLRRPRVRAHQGDLAPD